MFSFDCKRTKKINIIHIKVVTLHLKFKEQNMGIVSFLSKMFGTKSERDLKALTPILNEVLALEDEFLALTNDELRVRTKELRACVVSIGYGYRICTRTINWNNL